MPDFFETELLECQWRGIGFPVSSFRVRIQQTLVQHLRPDQDSARIESTGRNPLSFSATAPMYNSLAKGKNETWGVLYPDTHRKLIAAMSDRSSGILQHPSLGLILCKAATCESSLEATHRDGESLSLEWTETRDEDDVLGDVIGQSSPIGTATLNAIDLDEQIFNADLNSTDPDDGKMSFEEALRQVAGVFDKASLLSKKEFGIIDRVIYRLDAISFAIRSAGDPQNWPAKEAISKLRESLRALKAKAAKTQRDTRFYRVPAPTTLGNLAAKFKNTAGDMIRLNHLLVGTPEVAAGTLVRYYVTVT